MRLYNKGNFSMEADFARKNFETRVAETIKEVKEILPKMSRNYRKCDPVMQEEGKTYQRLTNLLQVLWLFFSAHNLIHHSNLNVKWLQLTNAIKKTSTCVLPNLTLISLAAVTCPFLYYSQINLSFRPKRQMATISK